MPVVPNVAKEKLKAGELAIGIGLRQARTVDIAKISAVAGFDWMFIDMEHNSMGMDTAASICSAGLDAGITPIVRSSHHASYLMSRPLDAGAQGIVAPHVDTVEEATRIRDQCLHPPVGKRSVGGPAPQMAYESLSIADQTRMVNENILVVCMVESPLAVANADAMAAIEGVDSLLIGTNDLCTEMGIPGQYGHDDVRAAYDTVAAACRNNGKHLGMGGVYDEALASEYIAKGARLILGGSDLSFLMQAAKSRASFLRGLKK
jgi:2-keto-3-deoxy-L-rhamnonate aldolase RhmA